MSIVYNDEKEGFARRTITCFVCCGRLVSGRTLAGKITKGFYAAVVHSTLVVSARDGDKLVGAVRVLSDTIFRSIIYDLLVAPEYQGKGIGGELVNRCKQHFSDSERPVGCDRKTLGFIRNLVFKIYWNQMCF
jgi:GNAT superfamily N-acetyltransferase